MWANEAFYFSAPARTDAGLPAVVSFARVLLFYAYFKELMT